MRKRYRTFTKRLLFSSIDDYTYLQISFQRNVTNFITSCILISLHYIYITIRILQTMYQALPDFTVILPTNHKRRCLHCKKYYAGVEFGMKSCNTHISHPILYRHPFSKFAYFSYLPQQPCSLPVSQFESFILLQNIAWR